MNNSKNEKKGFWLKLDNAAKIFPGQNSKTWSNSFRVCYELKERVEPELLQRALIDIMPRFSCYDVCIRHGFFWFYLEKNNNIPKVMQDIKNPCYRVKFNENEKFLFKVYYHGNRVAVDVYHVLTDGHGGAVFLSTLIARYLTLKGENIPTGGFVLDLNTEISKNELEDSFVNNANSKVKLSTKDKQAYHPKGTKLPKHTVNIISGTISFNQLHSLSKAKDVTVTEFVAAVMLQVLCNKQKREKKKQREVSVQIPIDLRRVYNSSTLRNFTICLRVKVNPNKGEYTFDELLDQVKYQLRLAKNEKDINAMITQNMSLERNPIIRVMPLFIKNLAIGITFALTAERSTSSLITNLGKIDIPAKMCGLINKFVFMPAPGIVNSSRCGIATVNDNLVITFANSYEESDVEREFFTSFVKMGLHVKIESNKE